MLSVFDKDTAKSTLNKVFLSVRKKESHFNISEIKAISFSEQFSCLSIARRQKGIYNDILQYDIYYLKNGAEIYEKIKEMKNKNEKQIEGENHGQ